MSLTQAYFNVDVICHTELQTDIINTKNATDVDLVFKRGDVEYMKFEGTLQAVELTKGAKSNTYDSIGNADVSFRRNTIDFMYLRNGNVEVNTGISLLAESAKFDAIDSATPTNVVFERGGVNFFTLDGTKNIIGVSTGRVLSSQYIYGDYFFNRNFGADMVFQGSNTTDDGLVEYMRYRKADEDLQMSQPIVMNRSRLYFNKAGGKEVYIDNFLESNVEMLALVNNDTTGQSRILCGGNTILDMSSIVLNLHQNTTVVAGKTLSGELVDTSSEKVKYVIKDAKYDFTTIVKNIKTNFVKMNEEKKQGIIKNHIGFVAEEVHANIPTDVENIIFDDDVEELNYVKLSGILWGCVQQQQKIEHLESSVYELQEAVEKLMKTKPQAKAKSKSKE